MGISEREKAIAILQKERKTALHDNVWAFDYAISSLKTDLKYDLMYEGKEIYTKDDMVAMLEELQNEIQKYSGCSCTCSDGVVNDIDDLIQEKINKLKGE
jgi:hypothetical protein